MMRRILVFAATIGLAGPVLADPPAPEAASPSAGAPAPPAAATGSAKAVREACRAQIKDQRVEGMDRRKAISDCVVKARPDLAQREQCRMDGFAKGLRKGELKAFVKDCTKGKG